ncbi:MAG: MFS transporter, partial [Actinobacteria bacterium]|nr:MFS transporter [Actinomycetota bacterium]
QRISRQRMLLSHLAVTFHPNMPSRTASFRSFLGLNRNVAVLAASLFGLALGEELWQAYIPTYLTALGASGLVVGLFGSCKDLLDSIYQYPGGWLADRVGRRRALLLFTALAMAGYATYAIAPSWPFVFVGLLGVMAWKSGAFPLTFAVIGDSLPRERRAMAFSVQSILVRVPRVIGAPMGGLLIASLGIVAGIRAALLATVLLALGVLAVQGYGYRDGDDVRQRDDSAGMRAVFAAMPPSLRQLLVADCLVRIGEGIATSFIILFVTQTRNFSVVEYGALYALQQAVAIVLYLPGGRIADMTGRGPMVALTFVFFATFFLAVRLATSFPALLAAFFIGGLKELGEPARKSLIVDLAPDHQRARTVGVYYGIRNLLVVPAGIVGGLLWQRGPTLPLEASFVVGAIGTAVFVLTSRRTG